MLTKFQLKALRLADKISFHKNGKESYICASKEVKNPQPFSPRELDERIDCDCMVRVYTSGGLGGIETCKCFEMIHSAKYCELWRTVCAFLKVDDCLTLEWTSSGNDYLRKSRCEGQELYLDRLFLRIRRGENTYRFYLDDCLCPNNTARMIRP